MLNKSLGQLEGLVGELLQVNQALQSANVALVAELTKAKDENESLQLGALEQEELQGTTLARIQALVELAATGNSTTPSPVNA